MTGLTDAMIPVDRQRAGSLLRALGYAAGQSADVWLSADLPLTVRLVDAPDMTAPTILVEAAAEELLWPDRWQALAEALRQTWPGRRLVVRAPADATVSEDLVQVVVFIERAPRADAVAAGNVAPVEVELLDPADKEAVDFVVWLLARAITHGMPDGPAASAVEQMYRERFGLGGPHPTATSLLARSDGKLVGHLTYAPEHDPLTGRRHLLIEDAYTVDEFAGRGVSRVLTAAFERHASRTEPGTPVRGMVVVAPDATTGGRHVVDALVADGWQAIHAWYAA